MRKLVISEAATIDGVFDANKEKMQVRRRKTKVIGYWVTTAILAFVILSGGVADLVQRGETVEGMMNLGYPLYFVTILGFWKVLGGIALLVPRFPRLKEWAYAGIFFEMTGAAASHAAVGNTVDHLIWTLTFAGLAIVSWALRPQSRTLGALFPAKMRAVAIKADAASGG